MMDQDEFTAWLTEMPDAIERFMTAVPAAIAVQLDYSPRSLDVLEGWLLAKYGTLDNYVQSADISVFDGSARYVGETFRLQLGGHWDLEQRKPSPYYLFPVWCDAPSGTPDCPHMLVTAAFDRQTGSYIRSCMAGWIEP